MSNSFFVEEFSADEKIILSRYFTNLDKPVFCLINLPEVVKGALYARYSRTSKSTRRLFLDEFVNRREIAVSAMSAEMDANKAEELWREDPSVAYPYIAKHMQKGESDTIFSVVHAEGLYRRVFDEYGDDSVSQLGGVHIVFEQASNVVINEIEWGRLAAYLEQSTRYIDYSLKQPDGRFRYHVPGDITESGLRDEYVSGMNRLFELYIELLDKAISYYSEKNPRDEFDGDDRAYRTTIRAKAFDAVRPMLPAGVVSNVGFFGSAQAAANMLRRLLSSELEEARALGQMALTELRHPDAAPAFFNQIDDLKKGLDWINYFIDTRSSAKESVAKLISTAEPAQAKRVGQADNEVSLAWSDPQNEQVVCAAIIYELNTQNLSMWESYEQACLLSSEQQAELISDYCGNRGDLNSAQGNRRWKPGRALELASYNFDMIIDFGIMRDFKRHRMLTAMWGELSDQLGWTASADLADMDGMELYSEAMAISSRLYQLLSRQHPKSAQYAVCLAYRMRLMFNINARALMFMLELRTGRQGHPAYREVGQLMHTEIAKVDPAIAEAMSYVDYNRYSLERAEAEKRLSQKRSDQSPL